MKYTILHISDLHKGKESKFDDLLDSLVVDRADYISKGIMAPEIIVVSGDLAEGVKGANADAEIRQQYAEVEDFLGKLAVEFLGGDRRRMVIVPGNHDINREISKQAMRPSVDAKKDDLAKFRRNDRLTRWSWEDCSFHHITDEELYATRFSLYEEFYNRFFNGIRQISACCEREGCCIALPDYNIAFALFNSCFRLDHLNFSGAISPSALTMIGGELREQHQLGRLVVGVWHHNISGLPAQNNYLDYRILQSMMRNHIQMGMFGHQHMSEIISEYRDLSMQNEMFLVSSGSLYGNSGNMPDGFTRQYNLLEVDIHDHQAGVTVHVRKDGSMGLYDIPSWQESMIGSSTLRSYTKTIKLAIPDLNDILYNIDEETRRTNDFVAGCKKLQNIGLNNPMVRKYFDAYLSQVTNPAQILEIISEPTNLDEAYMLLTAVMGTDDFNKIEELLRHPFIVESNDEALLELKREANNLLKYGKHPV